MEDSYKQIEIIDQNIIITHFIIDEYEEEVDNSDIDYQMYREPIIKSYHLAAKLGYCEIIEIRDEIIKIVMPKYNILLDNHPIYKGKSPEKPFVKKLCNLLDEMYEKKIIHWDFSPRNIGIDGYGDFKLIDLNDIYEFDGDRKFLEWFDLFECEFKNVGLGKKFLQARKYLLEKLSL